MDFVFLERAGEEEFAEQQLGKLAFTPTHNRGGRRCFLLPPARTPIANHRESQCALNRFSHEFAEREFGRLNRIAREPQRFAEKIPTIQTVGIALKRPLKSDVAVDCGSSDHRWLFRIFPHSAQCYTTRNRQDF